MQMKMSWRQAKRHTEKAEDQGGSRGEADDPDAAPGGEEEAEPSGSGNRSGLHGEEQDVGSRIEEEEETLHVKALVALQPCCTRHVVSHCEASHFQIRQLAISVLFFGCIFSR